MVRTSRGADSESEKNVKEKLRLFSPSLFPSHDSASYMGVGNYNVCSTTKNATYKR